MPRAVAATVTSTTTMLMLLIPNVTDGQQVHARQPNTYAQSASTEARTEVGQLEQLCRRIRNPYAIIGCTVILSVSGSIEGDAAAETLAEAGDEIDTRFNRIDSRLNAIENRVQQVETELSGLEPNMQSMIWTQEAMIELLREALDDEP